MADKKTSVDIKVQDIVTKLKENESSRFSKGDFQTLVFAILADKDFKAKRYLLKNGAATEEDILLNTQMRKFLDKLLKHAGLEDVEREEILNTFEYSASDIDWVVDAVDEAMYQYAECGKNMRVFRDKMLQLAFKKIKRTGAHAGKITYAKTVTDRSDAFRAEG